MQIKDTPHSYGWLSIFLHWIAAIIIVTLWLVGNTFTSVDADTRAQLQQFHISLGGGALLFMFFRVAWRLFHRHPSLRGQGRFIRLVGAWAHYIILVSVFAMLVSGPLMIWSQGLPIQIFDWFSVPVLPGVDNSVYPVAHRVHVTSAVVLIWLIVAHVAGAFKHYIFNNDDTFVRIFWPPRNSGDDVE
jgi:cytochrome b561